MGQCTVNDKACEFLPSRRGRVVRVPVTPPSTLSPSESPTSVEGLNGDGPYKRRKISFGPEGLGHQRSGVHSTNLRYYSSTQTLYVLTLNALTRSDQSDNWQSRCILCADTSLLSRPTSTCCCFSNQRASSIGTGGHSRLLEVTALPCYCCSRRPCSQDGSP